MTMTPYEIIRKKRGGSELTRGELEQMVRGFLTGSVADYQMAAFLMAVFFVGMTDSETETLTRIMLESGKTLDFSDIEGASVDKHSTGGVGDKLSLIAAPVAAAAGVRVPMISGRGLGHTGGTLDKLESIPGFRTDLDDAAFKRVVADVGMSIVGQSPEVAPADRRMYALRDVTATVECIPLIVGSILSKKLAAGLDALVLDVKVGRGAFMGDLASARELASRLIKTAGRLGLPAVALLTDMESPLGSAVGNALEVAESIAVLKGEGPGDVRDLSLAIASRMILLGGAAESTEAASDRARTVLDDGSALTVFTRFVEAQGGDASVVENIDLLPGAPVVVDVPAPRDGFVASADALEIGLASVALGAGRTAVGEDVDPGVGIDLVTPVGSSVVRGETMARIHARTEEQARPAADRVARAVVLARENPGQPRRLLETLE